MECNDQDPTSNKFYTLHTSKKIHDRSDISLRSSHSGHVRSGSYDNIPTPGPQVRPFLNFNPILRKRTDFSFQAAQFPSEPPSSYETISFPGRRSAETEPSLQSVGLVAEACRDYERREPVNRAAEPRQSVTRQNSGGSLGGHNTRLPPPYQSPPGPPPPYQPPPPSATTSPQRQINKQPSPQVILRLLYMNN